MSVTLLKADTFKKVEESIFNTIKDNRDKRSPIVLIVPDQFTQAIEKSLFKALDIRCSFDIDVMSFARLAKFHKRSNKPELNQQTSVLLLSKIIAKNSDRLTCYNKVAARGKFANQMYAVMTAIRNNNILPSKLANLAESLDGYLKNKVNDIALVFDCYLKELAENYSDISSLLDDFRGDVGELESIKSTDYYVFGFHSMTPNKRAIVNELMKYAKSVTLGLVDIAAKDNARISPSDIKALEGLAIKYGAKVFNYLDSDLTAEQSHCLDKIFGYNIARFSGEHNIYSIIRTRNVEDEIRQVAVAIRANIMQGYRYRDIAVVCEDFNKYEYLINKIFDSYNIQYFIDKKVAITNLPQFKFIVAAAAFLRSNYDRDYAMQLLKSLLCDINYDSICAFENYTLKYNIDRTRLLKIFELGDYEERVAAEAVRARLIEYISPMLNAYRKGSEDMVKACLDTLEMLKTTATSRYISEDDEFAQEAVDIAWTKLDDTLDDVGRMLGGSSLTGAETLEHIVDCLASLEFSLAPIKADSVFIGAPQESRFESAKIMFLMGANSQGYPITPSDSGIIRDVDIDTFYKFGVDLQPNHTERVKQSKFYIAQLLARANERVYISCPSLYDDMATIANQLKDMFCLPVIECNPNIQYGDTEREIALKIGTYANLPSIFCRNFGKGEVGLEELTNFAYGYSDREVVGGLFESISPTYQADCAKICFKDNYLKISGLEKFFDCPFSYFADNALKLKERPMGKVEINELGSFVHRILELFYIENPQLIERNNLLIGIVFALVDRALEEEEFIHFKWQDSSGGYIKQLRERCLAIIIAANKMLKRSKFRPLHLEYKFGMGGEVLPIELNVDGKIYYVRGVIDRVDSYGDQIIVIDYKSSDKDFDVKNVFCGHRLQLIVYLQALLNENTTCAGLYYLGVPYKYAKDKSEENIGYNYKGFIINDLESIRLQDDMVDRQTFLPLKYTRGDKEIDLSKENVLSCDDFNYLRQYAIKLVKAAVKTIHDGYISPTHIEKACGYCKFAMICKLKDKKSMQLKDIKIVWEKYNESTVE